MKYNKIEFLGETSRVTGDSIVMKELQEDTKDRSIQQLFYFFYVFFCFILQKFWFSRAPTSTVYTYEIMKFQNSQLFFKSCDPIAKSHIFEKSSNYPQLNNHGKQEDQ